MLTTPISLARQRHYRALLRVRWQDFEIHDLKPYLQKILTAENQTHTLHPHRLSGISRIVVRTRRIAVARRYVELGGRISPVLLARNLPPPRRWPGIVHLVETRGFDLYEPSEHTLRP